MTEPTVLVVEHEAGAPGRLARRGARAAPAAGSTCAARTPGSALPGPGSSADVDGVVVLGGGDGRLGRRRGARGCPTPARWCAAAEAAGVPALGICLGHQLAAAGARRRGRPEPGRHDARRAAGVLGRGRRRRPAVRRRARRGAARCTGTTTSSRRCPHGRAGPGDAAPTARCRRPGSGASVWGVQFHPEAGPAIVERWVARGRGAVRRGGLRPRAVPVRRAAATRPSCATSCAALAARLRSAGGGDDDARGRASRRRATLLRLGFADPDRGGRGPRAARASTAARCCRCSPRPPTPTRRSSRLADLADRVGRRSCAADAAERSRRRGHRDAALRRARARARRSATTCCATPSTGASCGTPSSAAPGRRPSRSAPTCCAAVGADPADRCPTADPRRRGGRGRAAGGVPPDPAAPRRPRPRPRRRRRRRRRRAVRPRRRHPGRGARRGPAAGRRGRRAAAGSR